MRVTKSAEPQTFNQPVASYKRQSNVPKIFPAALVEAGVLQICSQSSVPQAESCTHVRYSPIKLAAVWRLGRRQPEGETATSCNINIRRLFLLYCTHSRNHIACGKHIGPNKRLEQMGLGEEDRETLYKTLQGSFLRSLSGTQELRRHHLTENSANPYICLGSGH